MLYTFQTRHNDEIPVQADNIDEALALAQTMLNMKNHEYWDKGRFIICDYLIGTYKKANNNKAKKYY